MWTFGILLWEICEFGKLPYFELSDDEVISRVLTEKNYVLGQPTMPSLLLREELYELMSSCWDPQPTKRPPASTLVHTLSHLLSTSTSTPRPPQQYEKEDFEARWQGANGKKKSVSFSDGMPSGDQIQTKPSSSPFSKTQIPFENQNGDPPPSIDLSKPADPEEEVWRKRLERGDISKKVRVKPVLPFVCISMYYVCVSGLKTKAIYFFKKILFAIKGSWNLI